MTQVHVILVHYRCEAELRHALASVAADLAGAERVTGLTAWVVDNGTTPGASLEEPPLPLTPRLITPGENLGFGRGCNRALAGIDGGVVFFLNPDTRVLPGTLDALVEGLEDPGVGGVGARVFLDDRLRFTVSEPLDLTPWLPLRARLKVRLPRLGLERAELRRRWTYVTGREPGPTRMLVGACMALPWRVLRQAGGFHDGYFMYFEDLDLVRRIRRLGLRLLHHPGARVVHYYDRSARQVGERKGRWLRDSQALFEGRNFGALQKGLARAAWRLAGLLPDRNWPADLRQDPAEPRRLVPARPLTGPGPWLFEFSEGANYDITACALMEGEAWTMPEEVWEALVPKTYWTRLSRPDRGGPILHGLMTKEG